MNSARDTLYFDGKCGMCRRSVRILKRLDWLNRLAYQDSTSLPDTELPVSRDSSLTGMPMRTKNGDALIGFPAVRRALRQTPLGFVPAMILYVPVVSHFGKYCYDIIAARRSRDAACATE